MMLKAKDLVKGITTLPTIPIVATKVLELVDKPEIEINDVAELILSDQVMAARVIKMVNSPVYKPQHEIRSVKRALVHLGFHRIREIALTCSFMEAFDGKDGVFNIRTFWEHSFGVGVIARIIAQRVRYPDPEKAYILGVVHDIGEVFLSYYMKEEFQAIVDRINGTTMTFIEAEKEMLGTTHCEIGVCLGQNWNFPPDYCDTILFHHEPLLATVDPTLTAIVSLADLFCSVRELDYEGREWVSFDLSSEPAWEVLKDFAPHMSGFDIERFCYELDDKVVEVRELILSIFGPQA